VEEVAALRRENAELRAQVTRLIEELARLNERMAELLAIAQRKQRKVLAPAAAPPPAPAPAVQGQARKDFEERPKAPEKPAEERQEKEKARPTGRKPLPSHLEAEEHELRPEVCAECGGDALEVVDELVEEKLHVVKEHQRRRVVRRYTCRCRVETVLGIGGDSSAERPKLGGDDVTALVGLVVTPWSASYRLSRMARQSFEVVATSV
jgi:hypothetical protein